MRIKKLSLAVLLAAPISAGAAVYPQTLAATVANVMFTACRNQEAGGTEKAAVAYFTSEKSADENIRIAVRKSVKAGIKFRKDHPASTDCTQIYINVIDALEGDDNDAGI